MTHDVVIRGGTVVDGTGRAPRRADVAIDGDRIVAVGDVDGRRPARHRRRRRVRHARLRRRAHPPRRADRVGPRRDVVVLARRHVGRARQLRRHLRAGARRPGGLARRADGVGRGHPGREHPRRARVRLGDLRRLPRARSTRMPKGVNVGGMVGHCALRHYVMGERGLDDVPATDDDIAAMTDLVDEAMAAGALGFSTSRTLAAPRSRRSVRSRARGRARTSCSRSPTCSAATARACTRSRRASSGPGDALRRHRAPRSTGWPRSTAAPAGR